MGIDPSSDLVVPLSKGKFFLVMAGGAAFVVGSVWLWMFADGQPRFDPVVARVAAVAGVAFFGWCSLLAAFKFTDPKPGLVIDQLGIIDNSSGVAAGRILWSEVVGMKVTYIGGQRILTILVDDPRKFIDQGGWFRRVLDAANTGLTGSPVNISANSLATNFNDLVRALGEAYNRNRKPGDASDGYPAGELG